MTTHVDDDDDHDVYIDYNGDDYVDYDDDDKDYFSQWGVSDHFSLFYFMIPANSSWNIDEY